MCSMTARHLNHTGITMVVIHTDKFDVFSRYITCYGMMLMRVHGTRDFVYFIGKHKQAQYFPRACFGGVFE